jgi:hypothetical protein
MFLGRRHPRRASGQAAVETALTLPLSLFMVLGCIQLFMLMQAKTMAQYAIFQAARIGSVSNGRCDMMLHAAILSFIPAIRAFTPPPGGGGGSAGANLGPVFQEFRDNTFNTFHGWGAESIVWIVRESPKLGVTNTQTEAREQFDKPIAFGNQPVRLELRAIFWTPLLIPFADWVFTKMQLATLGLQTYNATNPLIPTQRNANWGASGATYSLDNPIASEYQARVGRKHYVYPIQVTYTMRMMSPVKASDFASQNCPGTPNSL